MKWTQKEKDYLSKNFANTSSKQLAIYLGRTTTQINNMARILELRKSRKYLKKIGKDISLKNLKRKG